MGGMPAQLTASLSRVNWGKIIGSAISSGVSGAGKIGAAIVTLLGKVNWADVGKKAAFALVPFAIGLVNNLAVALVSEAIHHPLDMALFIASLIPIGRVAGIVGKLLGDIPLLGPVVKLFTKPLEAAGGLVESALGKLLKRVFGPVLDRITPYFSAGRWQRLARLARARTSVGWPRCSGLFKRFLGLWTGVRAEPGGRQDRLTAPAQRGRVSGC